METFTLKQNDTVPSLRSSFTRANGTVVDLTNATVKLIMARDDGTRLIDRAATIEQQNPAIVRYDWQAGDTAYVGIFRAEFEVTYTGGGIETFPNYTYFLIEIVDDL